MPDYLSVTTYTISTEMEAVYISMSLTRFISDLQDVMLCGIWQDTPPGL